MIKVNPNIENSISVFGTDLPSNNVKISTFGNHISESEDIAVKPDYLQKNRRLIVEQYERSDNLLSLLDVFSKSIEEIEDVAQDLITKTSLTGSTGVQLDGIGEIVGVPRNGRNDTQYREVIRAKILLNRSGGEVEAIIETLKIIADITFVEVEEIYPARVVITSDPTFIIDGIEDILDNVAGAGIKVDFVFVERDEPIFAFDNEGIPENIQTAGFGEGAFAQSIGE